MERMVRTLAGRRREGFTLIEVLVAIAIILVLMAIALPAFFRARYSAWRTDEISGLRQLAIAGQIYYEEYSKFPVSTEVLYGRQYGIENIVYSRRDPYPDGFVNAYLAWSNSLNARNPPRPMRDHKLTFAGVGDFWPVAPMPDYSDMEAVAGLLAEYERKTANRANAGWLVSVAEGGETAYLGRVSLQFLKPILRMTFEGSVIRRPNCTIQTTGGDQAYGPMYCFYDSLPSDALD